MNPQNMSMNDTRNASLQDMHKASAGVMQAFEQINDMTRAYSEATMQSAAALTRGWEEITRSASGMMQETMAHTMNVGKTMMGAKSVQEAVTMQNDFVKEFMDRVMAGTGRLTEISARVSKEVAEPVTQHVSNTVSQVMSKAKAAA